MSGSSYQLETSRPRPPPPPLRFQNSSFNSSSSISNTQNSQPLLYDLPSAPSMSPPPNSPNFSTVLSPTSPTFPGRSRGGRKSRPTPPPTRNRSTTPLGATSSELEIFAEQCQKWYFNQDDNSGRLMTQTLANLPPSQRAPFSRLQASIRSAYHANVNARRNAEFQAHLSATQPGGSLMAHSRVNPIGDTARKERHDRLDKFIRSWCTMGMPGTKPFFEALWAVLRLQVVPEHLGGAGGNRIEWEFDDAVFKEAAGKDFMLEAIDILKGVLGFGEVPSSKRSPTLNRIDAYSVAPQPHSRTQSQPLLSNRPRPPPPLSSTGHTKRSRAPSDPFLDTPSLSRSFVSSSSTSSGNTGALIASDSVEEPPSPTTPAGDDSILTHTRSDNSVYDCTEEEYLRIWTSPDLPNPEFLALLDLFPSFITRRPLPRFPVSPNSRDADIEEGEEEGGEGKEIRFGTGTMWVSAKPRADGWEGTWWCTIRMWWRKTFSFC